MIRCTHFRPYEKNTLRGFVDLELTRVGLVLRDCAWHEKNGKQWVAFPARSYTDKDGGTQWQPRERHASNFNSKLSRPSTPWWPNGRMPMAEHEFSVPIEPEELFSPKSARLLPDCLPAPWRSPRASVLQNYPQVRVILVPSESALHGIQVIDTYRPSDGAAEPSRDIRLQ